MCISHKQGRSPTEPQYIVRLGNQQGSITTFTPISPVEFIASFIAGGLSPETCSALNCQVSWSPLVWSCSTAFPSLSWPWYFRRSQASHLVDSPSSWFDWCLLTFRFRFCGLGQNVTEATLCSPNCILSGGIWSQFVPLLMMVTWLRCICIWQTFWFFFFTTKLLCNLLLSLMNILWGGALRLSKILLLITPLSTGPSIHWGLLDEFITVVATRWWLSHSVIPYVLGSPILLQGAFSGSPFADSY